jgi:hypothetical protein
LPANGEGEEEQKLTVGRSRSERARGRLGAAGIDGERRRGSEEEDEAGRRCRGVRLRFFGAGDVEEHGGARGHVAVARQRRWPRGSTEAGHGGARTCGRGKGRGRERKWGG